MKCVFEMIFVPTFEKNGIFIELCIGYCTHRVISDKVQRLLVALFYFWISILILLLYLLVSIDLVYTGLGELVPE